MPDCILLLFGATGDLARRKLFPALYNLRHDRLLPERFAVCAYGRRLYTDDTFRDYVAAQLPVYSRRAPDADWDVLARSIFYVQGELNDPPGYQRLSVRLAGLERQLGITGNRIVYLALGPEQAGETVAHLAENGLLRHVPQGEPWTRLVLEKPIGYDLASARALLGRVAAHAAEEQVYRIDHYLGKETVQNILALRFGNCIFEPLWNRNYIDHVQITAAESEGVGGRAPYYERAGALRDVLQNHLLQLLALIGMEAPGTMSPGDIRNEKVKVFRRLRQMNAGEVERNTVRGQYGPGPDGQSGYRAEAGVAPESLTETFVAVRCFVDSWRWAGVPFLLRTGKRLARRETEISIHFRVPPLQLFSPPAAATCIDNVIAIRVQPHEGLSLQLSAKVPGAGMRLKNVQMAFAYQDAFVKASPEAYERLLLDTMLGDATLFMRADEVEAQWEFASAIHAGWEQLPPPVFPNYPAGSWGPSAANLLIKSCVRGWYMEKNGPISSAPGGN